MNYKKKINVEKQYKIKSDGFDTSGQNEKPKLFSNKLAIMYWLIHIASMDLLQVIQQRVDLFSD